MQLKFSSPVLVTKFVPPSKADADAEIGYFRAYASTWNRDRAKDIVHFGAFSDSIRAMATGQLSVPLLWQHDHSQPLGVILSALEDDRGLLVEGHIVTGDATADRAYRLMQKGALSLSIGFMPQDWSELPDGGYAMHKVDLHEISLVAVPANAQSTVLSVRSIAELSRSDLARMFSAGTFPPLGNRLSAVFAKACLSVLSESAPTDLDDEIARNESQLLDAQFALEQTVRNLKGK